MKKFFLLALCMIGFAFAQAQTSPYKGSEAAAGNFYIYNVETGYWLQNNNRVSDWNSQVQVDVQGFDWELIALEDDTWQLNPKFGNNHSLNSGEANGYLDTGQPVSAWTLTPANDGNNGYMISSNGTTLGVNPETKLLTKDGSGATTWQLVTEEERLQVFKDQAATVTGDNPVDLTWMIPGANMNIADERADALLKVYPENAGAKYVVDQTNNLGNGIREVWSNTGTYDIGYALNDMPAGVYRLVFSGYYRDGSVGEIGAKHDDGTETLRPDIYFNDKTQPVMSICQRTASGNGCNTKTGNFYVPNNRGEAAQATSRGYYVNPAVKVVLTEKGDLDFGVRASEGVGDDWLIIDYIKLVFYGPDNIEQYVALLQAAIDEAEAWDNSSTSTAMANELNAAIDEAKTKLTSTDGDELEAAAAKLKAALQAAKDVDVSVLKATIALAKKEGINTSAAEEVARNATNNSQIAQPLYNLASWRKVNAQKMADIYTGTEPAEGDFYFFNVGAGLFLSTGSDWNTHAAVDQAGWPVTISAVEGEEGRYTFNTPWGSFNNSPYVDTGVNTVYAFQAVEGKEGIYNILEGERLLGWNPNGHTDGDHYWSSISNTENIDSTDPYYQWKLITREEREALLEKASSSNPVDATFLINNPSLIRKPGYDMWKVEVTGGNGGARISDKRDARDRASDYGWEVWNADNFKFSQTIEGLQPGIYEVSATGFWREGDGGNQASIVNNGGNLNQKAYLFANDEKTPLPNVASCPDFVPGVATATSNKGNFPNWPEEAIEYFETGAFKATVLVTVGEDGTLVLGIGCDEKVTYGDWSVFDNFRLTYLGAGGQDMEYVRALRSIEDGANYSIFTEVDGQKYYLTNDGHLSAEHSGAGTFTFQKATKANGLQYENGFLLNSANDTRFSNPYNTSEEWLTNGCLNSVTGNRVDWEAQVFFLNEEGKYAIRATNAPYGGETSGWNWIGNTYWTANEGEEGPLAEYSWDKNFIWQLEKNTLVEVACDLIEGEEVTASTVVSMPAGFAPIIPTKFTEKFHGLYKITPDITEVTEETTKINYTPEWAGPFEFSESYDKANWYNMTIRSSYWVAVDESEPYYPKNDKDIDAETSQWAFKAVEGEPFQIIIWNRAFDEGSSLSVDGENVVMREGEAKWEIFANNGGFVMRPVGGGENDWVNQNGGSSGPLQFWHSANGRTDDGSTFRVESADPYVRALAAIEDGANYSIFTEIDGTKYYVTNDGHLTSEHNTAGTFTFQKATKNSGLQYQYGFLLNSQNNTRFSNPVNTTEAALTNGSFNATTNNRVDWEAQVFFLSAAGKYAVRATNAPYNNETSGWNWIGNSYWTANEGPVAEYSWEPNYIWQLEKNTLVEIACNLVEDGEVTATEKATVAVGFTPAAPAAFKDKFHGLYSLTPDVEVVAKETTEVNFTPAWAGPFEFSESFEGAKWYNMTIRSNYWVAVDESEPYYPGADKALDVAKSQWAFKAVDGEPFQIIIWNRAFDEGSSLSVDGENVVMREGEAKWEIFGNNGGFVMRPVGGGENDWVNQNGGSSGPLQFWHSANGRTDDGSTFRVEEAPDIYDAIHDVNADAKVDGVIYDIAGRRVAQPTKGVFIINRKKVAVK